MLIEEIIPGINLEGPDIEFKRVLDEGKSPKSGRAVEINWLKTLVAYANSNGGTIYVGVDDSSHQIISLDHEEVEKTYQRVRRQLKQRIEPEIRFDFDPVPVTTQNGTRYIIRIKVYPSKVLPVTLHEDNLLGIYIRKYSSTELATPEQIRDLVLLSDSSPFDSLITEKRFNESDFSELLSMYESKNGAVLSEKALVTIGFMDEDGRLSRGAELFTDNYDGDRTRVVCTLWPETTKGSLDVYASTECTGNLFDCILNAVLFVKHHSVEGYRKEEAGRVDIFSYPVRSVTEGIVNAVAHRNYFIQGSQIEVNMFKDRLEITSPGTLLGVSRLEKEKNLASIIPRRRNEVICAVLGYVKLMESKGSGFDRIEQDYSGRGEAFRPFVSCDSSSFTLTLPNLMYRYGVIDETTVPEVYAFDSVLDARDQKILGYAFAKGRTAAEIASFTGVEPSTYFRKNILGTLVGKGYLIEEPGRPLRYRTNANAVGVV